MCKLESSTIRFAGDGQFTAERVSARNVPERAQYFGPASKKTYVIEQYDPSLMKKASCPDVVLPRTPNLIYDHF